MGAVVEAGRALVGVIGAACLAAGLVLILPPQQPWEAIHGVSPDWA